jgi:hypothetical protein
MNSNLPHYSLLPESLQLASYMHQIIAIWGPHTFLTNAQQISLTNAPEMSTDNMAS